MNYLAKTFVGRERVWFCFLISTYQLGSDVLFATLNTVLCCFFFCSYSFVPSHYAFSLSHGSTLKATRYLRKQIKIRLTYVHSESKGVLSLFRIFHLQPRRNPLQFASPHFPSLYSICTVLGCPEG